MYGQCLETLSLKESVRLSLRPRSLMAWDMGSGVDTAMEVLEVTKRPMS